MSFALGVVAANLQKKKRVIEAQKKYIARFNGVETFKVNVLYEGIVRNKLKFCFISNKNELNQFSSFSPYKGSIVSLYRDNKLVFTFISFKNCTLKISEVSYGFFFHRILVRLV
jgi:hypothetical protein